MAKQIYFVQCGQDGPIKIGFTAGDPGKRMKSMQCNTPHELKLMGTKRGGLKDERRLHIKFALHHIRGEWFHPVPDLLEFIKSDAVPAQAPVNLNAIEESWAGLPAATVKMLLAAAVDTRECHYT